MYSEFLASKPLFCFGLWEPELWSKARLQCLGASLCLRRPLGRSTALESKCELCFKIWQAAYAYLDWDRLCAEALDAKSAVAGSLEGVRKKVAAGSGPEKGAAITEVKRVELEVSRAFFIATESEIKSKLKVLRIAKSQVKGLTSLSLPNDAGTQDEVNYIFKDTESPFRKLTCKVTLGHDSVYEVLSKDSNYWDEQAAKHLQAALGEREKTFGVTKLFQTANVPDFESWSASKFNLKSSSANDQQAPEGCGRRGRLC